MGKSTSNIIENTIVLKFMIFFSLGFVVASLCSLRSRSFLLLIVICILASKYDSHCVIRLLLFMLLVVVFKFYLDLERVDLAHTFIERCFGRVYSA